MVPSFLITFREVIESALIIATILGILIKLKHKRGVAIVWAATASAALLSVLLLGVGSLFGIRMQELYSGSYGKFIEGLFMVASAIFITCAVFFLHTYFARYKTRLLIHIKQLAEGGQQKGLFWLAFTTVFREGFEIVLFLTTIYFSSDPQHIYAGFAGGLVCGLFVSFGLFTATVRLPILWAFRITSALLILFAGGLFARGIHEFVEAGVLPELMRLTLVFVPDETTPAGDIIQAVFGITRSMDASQLFIYGSYVCVMIWRVFVPGRKQARRQLPNTP